MQNYPRTLLKSSHIRRAHWPSKGALVVQLLSWVFRGIRSGISLDLMSTSSLLQLWDGAPILGCVVGVRAAFLLPSSRGMRWEKSLCPMQVRDLLGSSDFWLAGNVLAFSASSGQLYF